VGRQTALSIIGIVVGAAPTLLHEAHLPMPPLVVWAGGILALVSLGTALWPFMRVPARWSGKTVTLEALLRSVGLAIVIPVLGVLWTQAYLGRGAGYGALDVSTLSTADTPASWVTYAYTTITDRTFKNETVLLDGHHYLRCRFHNVQFVYNASAPVMITEPQFVYASSVILTTARWDINAFNAVATYLFSLGREFKMGQGNRPMWIPAPKP
jgi:hypothetical protein